MPRPPKPDELLKTLKDAAETARAVGTRVGAALPSRDAVRDVVGDVVGGAASAARTATSAGAGAVKEVGERVSNRLPSKDIVKVALGKALVQGGRVLIDPQAAVGEFAVRAGESLLTPADQVQWFVVRLDAEGRGEVFPFVLRKAAEQFIAQGRAQFSQQYLCEVVAGPGPASPSASPPPSA
jgi:hypothetical protein